MIRLRHITCQPWLALGEPWKEGFQPAGATAGDNGVRPGIATAREGGVLVRRPHVPNAILRYLR